ncbi:MAG: hypothetical protein ACRED4_04165, partial [Brevundimonas sp.]
QVDRPLLHSALQTHDQVARRYTDAEAAIRDCFDAYFGYLDRFQHFVRTGLISRADLRPYLEYWVTTIDQELEPVMKERVRDYVTFYRFDGAQMLLASLGVTLWHAGAGRRPPPNKVPSLEVQDNIPAHAPTAAE